jgi:hypothetical protein
MNIFNDESLHDWYHNALASISSSVGKMSKEKLFEKDNVLDVKCEVGSGRLRHPTVFTSLASPIMHNLSCGSVHAESRSEQATGLRLHHGHKMIGGKIPVIFRSLGIGQCAPIGLVGQLIHAGLQCVVGLESRNLARRVGSQTLSKWFCQAIEKGCAHVLSISLEISWK